jgi:hypothetical protein
MHSEPEVVIHEMTCLPGVKSLRNFDLPDNPSPD